MKRDRPTPKQEKRLLAWVNEQRAKLGRKRLKYLKHGVPGIGLLNCPLARSIGPGCRIERGRWGFQGKEGYTQYRNPKYVQRFIQKYDLGDYPGLEA